MRILLCLLIAIAGNVIAQPRISYLTPDVGTTRWATYVEIIGPYDVPGVYGSALFSMNNPGDALRVRCARPADTATITIGPLVVSWDGRMISTMIFVSPLAQPNSDRWQDLRSEFRIPIVVEFNGSVSQPDTFYVVRPFTIGDLANNPDRVFGEGSLGRRSPRGAMIIDSAILAATAAYTISLVDPDSRTPGNQAYLPFTLIALGDIRGRNGSQIRADADGPNGGPGGGGGGGGYANYNLLSNERGEPGGNGFTGGGPGGYNNSGIPGAQPSSKRRPGAGSGETLAEANTNTFGSRALNGLPGGESTTSHENAGGGTGHPFGLSGTACAERTSCDPSGGFGGGSGSREAQRGGGGGFGTDGTSERDRQNGGRAHGNKALVPLAGGSGGASGNPDGFNESSTGGGGGGAIAIHGRMLANFDVYALGAAASTSKDINGGAGSGGGVILGMRFDNAAAGFVSAQVGSRTGSQVLEGGRGRARYDARVGPSDTYYRGPLTDTLTYTLLDMPLSGHGDGSILDVYVKPERGPWRLLDSIQSDRLVSWRAKVRLPRGDTLYYVAVAQRYPSPTQTNYTYDPHLVFSQSAWNIVHLFGPSIIDAPTSLNMGVYRCQSVEQTETIVIRNDGDSPLEIAEANWAGAPGFRIVSPTVFPDSVPVGGSKQYVIGYMAPDGTSGPQVGQLLLTHDDTTQAGTKNPWRVDVSVDVRMADLEYRWRGISADTINLGTLCVGAAVADEITVTTIGTDATLLVRYVTTDASLLEVAANLPFTVNPSLSRNLGLTLTAKRIGPAVVATLLYVDQCPEPDTIWLSYEGVQPFLRQVGDGQFGDVSIGSSRTLTIELRNDGTSDADLSAPPTLPAPFRIVSVVPALPSIVKPGNSVLVTVEYTPTTTDEHTAILRLETIAYRRSCADTTVILLAGRGVRTEVVIEPTVLSFKPTGSCGSDTLSAMVRNTGSTPVRVIYPAFINGVDAADFAIVQQPVSDTTLPAGGSATYEVVFAPVPGSNAQRTGSLHVRTDQTAVPEVVTRLAGSHVRLQVDGPTVIDLGLLQSGAAEQRTVPYTNTSGGRITVSNLRSTRPAELQASPTAFVFDDGAIQDLLIEVTPLVEGAYQDTIVMVASEPCPDSVAIVVRWTVEAAELGVQNVLDFGTLSTCESARDTMTIANTSAFPVELVDAVITGADAALFTIVNPAAVTNASLAAGQTVDVIVDFTPQGGTDGLKSAILTTRARLNTKLTSFTTRLEGIRQTAFPSTPGVVAFGNVDVLSSSVLTTSVVNTSTLPVRVLSVRMQQTPSVFSPAAAALPRVLAPGERLDIIVTFTPTDARFFADSILVEVDQPCSDVRPIPVYGTGRLNVEFSLVLPEVVIDPTNDNVVLPVRGRIATGTAETAQTSLDVLITYESPLFVAQQIVPGTIVRHEVIGGRTQLEVNIPATTISKTDGVVFEIHGQGTLGSIDSTDLTFERAVASAEGTTPKVRTSNGWLKTELCEAGGDRLITRAGSLAIVASPTPASDDLILTVSLYEKGLHDVQMIDATGTVVDRWSWMNDGPTTSTFTIPVQNLGSGTYRVILRTPTRQRSVPAVVIH